MKTRTKTEAKPADRTVRQVRAMIAVSPQVHLEFTRHARERGQKISWAAECALRMAMEKPAR